MKIGSPILKVLSKLYEPDSFIEIKFQRYDLGIKTDGEGNPVLLFIGNKGHSGKIKGERFSRRLLRDPDGAVIKDHWDNKGRI